MGKHFKQQEEGVREYPPLETAMEETGFEDMGAYVLNSQNTFVQYIETRPILDLCKKTVRSPGDWVSRRW